jgi:hypothetical protein
MPEALATTAVVMRLRLFPGIDEQQQVALNQR